MKPLVIIMSAWNDPVGYKATESGAESGLRFFYTIRNDNSGRMCLSLAPTPRWFQMKFPLPVALGGIAFKWSAHNSSGNYEMVFMGSNDGITWNNVYTWTPGPSAVYNEWRKIFLPYLETKYQYWRIQVNTGSYMDVTIFRFWLHADILLQPIRRRCTAGQMAEGGNNITTSAVVNGKYYVMRYTNEVYEYDLTTILNGTTDSAPTAVRQFTLPVNYMAIGNNENNTKMFITGNNQPIAEYNPDTGQIVTTYCTDTTSASRLGLSVNESLGIFARYLNNKSVSIRKLSDCSLLRYVDFTTLDLSLASLMSSGVYGVCWKGSRLLVSCAGNADDMLWCSSQDITLANVGSVEFDLLSNRNELSVANWSTVTCNGNTVIVQGQEGGIALYSLKGTTVIKCFVIDGTDRKKWNSTGSTWDVVATPIDAAKFLSDGMDFDDIDDIPESAWQTLTANWTTPVEFDIYTQEIEDPVVTATKVPTPAVLKQITPISLTSVEHIDSFTLAATENTVGQNFRFAVSTDNGTTWYTRSGNDWNLIDVDTPATFKTSGMTLTTFNGTTSEQWETRFGSATSFSLAIYIEYYNGTDNASINTLSSQFDLLGRWKQLHDDSKIDALFGNSEITFRVKAVGSYKVNYQ